MGTVTTGPWSGTGFRHEALLYRGLDDFVRQTAPFIRDGLHQSEPVLVVVQPHKVDLLRDELDGDADRVDFADMTQVGANPACIIPAWQSFLEEHASDGRPVRGVGEPVWPQRSPDELVECQLHEQLLNIAFPGVWPFWLLCPYDEAALAAPVLAEAERSHPMLQRDGSHVPSPRYPPDGGPDVTTPLPDPPHDAADHSFSDEDLARVRGWVAAAAAANGLDDDRACDLVAAVNELATNSVRHGGGAGRLRMWRTGQVLVCEVRDGGGLADPLVGRRDAGTTALGGRGLWLANRLVDLLQVRGTEDGVVARAHVRLSGS